MHIHGNQTNLNAINPYSAAAERATAALRAAEVRKKLIKSAATVEDASDPDEAFMVGHWMETNQGRAQGETELHIATAGKDSDFG